MASVIPFPRTLPSGGVTPGDYREYRRSQVMQLLALVPKGAIRPLYRQAHAWAVREGLDEPKDPLAALVAFCDHLMPLPPRDIWEADFLAHPDAYLGPSAKLEVAEPFMVMECHLEYRGRPWRAALEAFTLDGNWRGYIRFSEEGGHSVRTADIFCEAELNDLRNRFSGLDPASLSAFLRSVLP